MNTNRVSEMGNKIVEKHIPGWKFGLDRSVIHAGRTSFRHKTVYVSEKVAMTNSPATVKNLILHEVSHAQSTKPGHGEEWQAIAKKIGVEKQFRKPNVKVNAPYGYEYVNER